LKEETEAQTIPRILRKSRVFRKSSSSYDSIYVLGFAEKLKVDEKKKMGLKLE